MIMIKEKVKKYINRNANRPDATADYNFPERINEIRQITSSPNKISQRYVNMYIYM